MTFTPKESFNFDHLLTKKGERITMRPHTLVTSPEVAEKFYELEEKLFGSSELNKPL